MTSLRIALLTAVIAAACAGGGVEAPSAAHTVEIDMVDIAYQPDQLNVAVGDTVTFVFTNSGEVAHDAFIGDRAAQAVHEQQMRDAEHGGHGADADVALTVEPGGDGELTYTFDEPGELEVGCHQPGHYDAGMRIAIEVGG